MPLIETEEILIIETPERVRLDFASASIGNRFLAVLIDHFIQYFSLFVVVYLLAVLSNANGLLEEKGGIYGAFSEMPKWTTAVLIIVLFAVFAGYFMVFEWLWNGQTPGKRLMKLRVIREDGRPITFWESAARNILRIFDAFPGFVVPVYSVGLIVIFAGRQDRRLGDLFAGTVVVRESANEAPTFSQVFSSSVADSALLRVQKPTHFTGDINVLTEAEIEVVEAFLRRRADLSDRQRLWMAWRVALPLMYKIKPRYDLENFTYEGFLEELLHRCRAQNRFAN